MQSSLSAKLLLIVSAFISAGCAASGHTETFTPPTDFDARNYINPKDYGYKLLAADEKAQVDSSFVPIEYNIMKVQRRVEYPYKAYRRKIQGRVILKTYIDSTGTVVNISVIESPHKLLTNAAKKSVIQTQFRPAKLNSKAVNSFTIVPVIFRVWSSKNHKE